MTKEDEAALSLLDEELQAEGTHNSLGEPSTLK